MNNRIAYVWLGLAIAFAAVIAIWFLVVGWQGQMPVDAPESEQLDRQTDVNTRHMQDSISEKLAGRLSNEQQQRLDSPLGLALFRKCSEWTDFNDNHPSESTRINVDQACSEYRRYVETGDMPE